MKPVIQFAKKSSISFSLFILAALLVELIAGCNSQGSAPAVVVSAPEIGEPKIGAPAPQQPGEEIGISVDVSSGSGVALTYTWNADGGEIVRGQGSPAISYRVPEEPGTYNIRVKIEWDGQSVEKITSVKVKGAASAPTPEPPIETPELPTDMPGPEPTSTPKPTNKPPISTPTPISTNTTTPIPIPTLTPTSTPTPTPTVEDEHLTYNDYYSFQSYNYPSYYIRHSNYLGEISQISSTLDKLDATFKIVPGLADSSCVSFESLNYPKHYLRHQNNRVKLHSWENSQLFREDATFCVKPGLADPELVSFESYNYPDYFLRHRNSHLYIEQDNSDLFRADTTFKIVEPWGP